MLLCSLQTFISKALPLIFNAHILASYFFHTELGHRTALIWGRLVHMTMCCSMLRFGCSSSFALRSGIPLELGSLGLLNRIDYEEAAASSFALQSGTPSRWAAMTSFIISSELALNVSLQ
jgi:hypothetical protein